MQKTLTTILFSLFLLLPVRVFAAQIQFNPASVPVPQAKSFTTTITLNTEGESLNAIEGTILVSKEFKGEVVVSDSGSIVTYWVTRPEFDRATGSIRFSGTIPGGYSGQTGILFSVILPEYSGPKINNGLTLANPQGFLNDGFGTPARISAEQFALGSASDIAPTELTDQLYLSDKKLDNIPPESFDPQVTRDDSVLDGKWFVAFATTDKQSGLDRFEIQESRSGQINSGSWKVAQSPYLLEDQSLQSYIFITAIDKQGNERVIKVFPKYPQGFWQRYGNDLAILIGVLLVVLIVFLIDKKRNSSSATNMVSKNPIKPDSF